MSVYKLQSNLKTIGFESSWIVICCLTFVESSMEKDNLLIKKVVKIYEINQRLNSWASVPIAFSLCLALTHIYRRTLWTIGHSLVFISRKNTGAKTKNIRNIQWLLLCTVCLDVTLTDNFYCIRLKLIFSHEKLYANLRRSNFL